MKITKAKAEELIRLAEEGFKVIHPTPYFYLGEEDGKLMGCFVGAILVAKHGDFHKAQEHLFKAKYPCEYTKEVMGVPEEVAFTMSIKYWSGKDAVIDYLNSIVE